MHEALHVIWELMLVVASVLIFRSAWLLIDVYFGNGLLWSMLLLGLIIAVFSLYVLNNHQEKFYRKKAR